MEQKKGKKGTPPPRYDEAFKAGAVRLVAEQGHQPTDYQETYNTLCLNKLVSPPHAAFSENLINQFI